MNKLKIVLLFFIVSLIVSTLVSVLQTIAWGQVAKVYPPYAVEVGRVKPGTTNGERAQWKTEGTFAVLPGKDARLYIKYLEDEDKYVLILEPTKEHAATDGYIPPLKIHAVGSSHYYLEARKE